VTARAAHSKRNSASCSTFKKTVQAVKHSKKQRKLFNIRENSASCSSFEKTAQAVQHLRKQRKLFIVRENSTSCSTFEKTAQAVHLWRYHHSTAENCLRALCSRPAGVRLPSESARGKVEQGKSECTRTCPVRRRSG